MDPSVRSLLPTHQLGMDGAEWWIGQVEEIDQSKKSNRFRVRIIGVHDSDCESVKTVDLPWAHTALPVTTPYKTGGVAGASANLEESDWVFGFWLDVDKTKPLIIGSIGTIANSSEEQPEDPASQKGESCLSFKNTVNARTNPVADLSAKAEVTNKNLGSAQVAGNSQQTLSAADGAHAADNSAANPFGTKVCVTVAQAECNADMKSELTTVLGELFKMVQDSGGNLGDYLTSKVNGEIFSYINKAQGYINKVMRIIKDSLARVRGEIVKYLKEGIEKLVKLILTPFEGVLDSVQKFLEETLEKIGCSIADIYERLVDFITALIFDYLLKVFRAATCQVDTFVNAIINQITGYITNLLNVVLGPLNAILGIASSALNLVGGAMFKIMQILGISCSGVNSQCGSENKRCNKKEKDPVDDFLDGLLAGITNGPLDYGQSVCDDSRYYDSPSLAGAIIYGGTPYLPSGTGSGTTTTTGNSQAGSSNPSGGGTPGTPGNSPQFTTVTYSISDTNVLEGSTAQILVTRSGDISASSSIRYQTHDLTAYQGIDYQDTSGILGFGPNQISRSISVPTFADTLNDTPQEFEVSIAYSSGVQTPQFINTVATVTIGLPPSPTPSTPAVIPPNILVAAPSVSSPQAPTGGQTGTVGTGVNTNVPVPSVLVASQISIDVTSDKLVVNEGEFVTYTITSNGIPDGTVLSYTLFGTNITSTDIVGGNLFGTFSINNNSSIVVVGIADDISGEGIETLVFSINGTGATTSVDIVADPLVPGQINTTPPAQFTPPTVGDIVVDDAGRILQIPIADPGDRYILPPSVAVTGQGWGAMAVALLDPEGYVSEIRVTQRGRNFVPNKKPNLDCVLDSLTLTRPGTGYTSVPTVYVDGDSSLVVARINAQGFVSGFDVVNRTTIFESSPTVEIIGGGGFGAKALASLACIDSETRDLLGYAKIGTGRYVDCPS